MNRFLALEVKRIIHSKRFLGVIFIGGFLAVVQYFTVGFKQRFPLINWSGIGVRYPQPWYEYWMGGEWYSLFSYTFYMIFPLLATATIGDTLVSDRTSGYLRHMFILGERKQYYKARFISAFFSGGIVIIIPLLLNMLLCAVTCPSVYPQAATGTAPIFTSSMWSSLYFSHPLIYTFLYLLVDFVYGGLFASFSVAIGIATRNRFLPLVFPFITYLFSFTVFSAVGLYKYAPFNFLSPSQRVFDISFLVIVIEAVLILVPTVLLFVWGAKKDETL